MVEPSCDYQMVEDCIIITSLNHWVEFKSWDELLSIDAKRRHEKVIAEKFKKCSAIEDGAGDTPEKELPPEEVCSTMKKEILLRDFAMYINKNIDGDVAVEPYDKMVRMNRWIAYGCLGKIADMLIDVEPANRDEIAEFGEERVLPLHSDVDCMVNVAWSSVKDIYYDLMIAKIYGNRW